MSGTESSEHGTEYFDAVMREPKYYKLATKIVAEMVSDISDRAGFGNLWCELDTEMRLEIFDDWTKIVCKELNGGTNE
jgi:hypothetical protein